MNTKSLKGLARVAFSVNTLVFRDSQSVLLTYLKEREKNKRKGKSKEKPREPESPAEVQSVKMLFYLNMV